MSPDKVHVVCPHCDAVNRVPRARLGEGGKCGVCHRPLFVGAPAELSEARAEIHLGKSDIPVLIDFWAPWCGPCHMMAPHFAQAARQLEPQMRLAKVNLDEAPTMAARYQIRSIPTVILFANGREIARKSGALSTSQILAWARPFLATAATETKAGAAAP